MKKNDIVKLTLIILIVLFCSLYFTSLTGYYEYTLNTKTTLTNEALLKFEEDVKNGKKIIASNYIEEQKDYKNEASKLAIKLSNLIETSFNKIIKIIFRQIEKTINS